MVNSDNLCMSCMKEINDAKECPHCGFHADSQQIAPYLPIRSVLGNRFLVGKLLNYNGDGATYMGLDLTTRESVNVREFFPVGVAHRDSKTLAVSPIDDDRKELFDDCLQSYIEMWRKLMRLSGLSALIKVQAVFEGNGTCYVITENIDGITLRDYLLQNDAGYLTWDKARPLLMPVLSTLGTLHSSGIIHRGISPVTLIVGVDGKVRITGFSISPVRSARSVLKPQLYNGYAAFEQYGFDGRQGTWTDVYGFGAVLYRTLIGTDPIDATERVTNDRLMVPGKFAEQLPAYVINGLVNSLQILPEDRTRTVDELRGELSASPSATVSGIEYEPTSSPNQPKYHATAQRIAPEDNEEQYISEKRAAAEKSRSRSTAVIVVATVIIVICLGVIGLFASGVLGNISGLFGGETTTVSLEEVDVPNFVNKGYEDVINDAYNKKNFTFEKSEVYSSTVEEGIIISQSEEVNSKIAKGSTIKLTVSKGKESIVFPSAGIVGLKYEEAYVTLTKAGFTVMKLDKLNIDGQIAGTVAGFSLEAGASYDKGSTVYLFVWSEQETTTTTQEETTTSILDRFRSITSDETTTEDVEQPVY